MTTEQAIRLITGAADPAALFTGDRPKRCYRQLAALVHPDIHPGDAAAAAAFQRLSQLWDQFSRGDEEPAEAGPLFTGDIANLYLHEGGLVKIPRDPADNDLMDREARALKALARNGDTGTTMYASHLISRLRYQDPATGMERRANVIGRHDHCVTLADVHDAYPAGVDPKDAAWMWRRLLVAIGHGHLAGLTHAAVTPDHVLIQPEQHGLVLVDWCYALQAGERAVAVPAQYADWYPPDTKTAPPGHDLDIWLAAKCMLHVMGERVPRQLAAFARGCMLARPESRPSDAGSLLLELDDVLERLWGPRKFHPFSMPPAWTARKEASHGRR